MNRVPARRERIEKGTRKLDQQLEAVRARWMARDALLATTRTVLSVVPVCMVLGWLDYRTGFSHGVRAVELAALLGWTAWAFSRFVWPAIGRRRDAYTTALCVESVYGQFGGRLVSRVEFCGPTGAKTAECSAELIDAMCQRVEDQAADLSLPEVIDLKPVRRPAVWAIVVLAVLCAVAVARPQLAGLWIRRTLLPFADAPWPRRTQIAGVEQEYRIRRGDSVRVTGGVTGAIPRSGKVTWRSVGGEVSTARRAGHAPFDIDAQGRFTFSIGPLLDPAAMSIEIGDADSRDIHVDVVIPPELVSIEAIYNYPGFTGRQPDRVQSGDVRALVGTAIDLTMEADRPVERMGLVFKDDSSARTEPVRLISATRGQASFVVRSKGRYEVWLYDAYGFAADSPATFVIEPIENELPRVRITRPGAEHVVTPATRLRLRFEASDDFGVAAAAVRWTKQATAGAEPSATSGAVPIPVGPPRRTWNGEFEWDLAGLDLQAGDRIEYHIEGHDAGEHLAKEEAGVSGRQRLSVFDPDTLRQSLEVRLREAFGELDDLIAQQRSARDAVGMAIVSLPTGDEPLAPAEVRRIQAEQHRQTRLLRQVGRLAGRIGDVADALRDSFLAEAGQIERLQALAAGLQKLCAGPMQQVVAHLEQARAALGKLSPAEGTEPQER